MNSFPSKNMPLTEQQFDEITAAINDTLCIAEQLFGSNFPSLPVYFDLKGRAAGMYVHMGTQRYFRFNPWLFAANFSVNVSETIPHEIAHYVVDKLYGRRNIRPHGAQWRQVMLALGVPPKVTHSQSMESVPMRRVSRYNYQCACQNHQLSAIRHNRIQQGRARYHCKMCHQPLALA